MVAIEYLRQKNGVRSLFFVMGSSVKRDPTPFFLSSLFALGLPFSLPVGLYLASRIGWRPRSFRPSKLVAKDLKVVVSR